MGLYNAVLRESSPYPELPSQVTSRRTGRFARRQVALAKGLAHHAIVALETARLYLVRRRAQVLGGRVRLAEADPGRTGFEVTLPLRSGTPSAA